MKAFQIRIELIDFEPLIWRRVVIPADVTFRRLHDTIQFSMGWRDYHLYEFEFPQEKLRITNDEESYEEFKFYSAKYKNKKPTKKEDPHGIITRIIEITVRQPQTVKIDKYLEKYRTFEYIYDFGDYWRHKIELEKTIEDYEFGYPIILEGKGACPPEDVGGLGGYKEFLEAWNDPKHPEHESMRQWGESQHYREFDIDFRNDLLKTCLKIKEEPAYVLRNGGEDTERDVIRFRNPYHLRIRYDRLIAECLKISRSEAKRVLENGVLSVEVVP